MNPPKGPLVNGVTVEISDLKEEIKELRGDFKKWLETTNSTHQDIAKLLATHNEQIINLQACSTKQEARHEGLVLKLWGLAAGTILAIIGAVLAFLFRNS